MSKYPVWHSIGIAPGLSLNHPAGWNTDMIHLEANGNCLQGLGFPVEKQLYLYGCPKL